MSNTYGIPRINRSSGVERVYPVWPMSEVVGVSAIKPAWVAKNVWVEMYGISHSNGRRVLQNIPTQDTPSFKSYLEKCLLETENGIEV